MLNHARVVYKQGINATIYFLPPQSVQGDEHNVFCFGGFGLRKKA
jgi:hypothetical protein